MFNTSLSTQYTEGTLEWRKTEMGPTEEKLYLGIGLGTGLLVTVVLIIIVVASILTRNKNKTKRPRSGRFASVANSDFDTYNAINPLVFSTPVSGSFWDHRQLPSSPTPTITTIPNGYYSPDNENISMKIIDQMFGHKVP